MTAVGQLGPRPTRRSAWQLLRRRCDHELRSPPDVKRSRQLGRSRASAPRLERSRCPRGRFGSATASAPLPQLGSSASERVRPHRGDPTVRASAVAGRSFRTHGPRRAWLPLRRLVLARPCRSANDWLSVVRGSVCNADAARRKSSVDRRLSRRNREPESRPRRPCVKADTRSSSSAGTRPGAQLAIACRGKVGPTRIRAARGVRLQNCKFGARGAVTRSSY